MPTFNYGHLISDAIKSIQVQSYGDWELLVIDDGSTDETCDIVAKFTSLDNRIQYFYQSNNGPSAARNTGISRAKGDFIQFLDADDVIQSLKLEKQLAIFDQNPSVDVVYGLVRYFTKDPGNNDSWLLSYWGKNKEWMPFISGQGEALLTASLKGSFAHISCFLFRRNIITKAGLWDSGKRAAEDYLFVLNCILVGARFLFERSEGSYALVRWHANNTSRNTRWIHDEERKMRIELQPRIEATGNLEAIRTNREAIRALELMNSDSWRKKFLSGGSFDSLKKVLRYLGLEKIVRRLFYL